MLRNVALTGPYGHNGAYRTLEGIIRHHLAPQQAFDAWQPSGVDLPVDGRLAAIDFIAFQDRRERERLRAKVDIKPVDLRDDEVAALVAFLEALTGSSRGVLGRPQQVPSGLPVD